VAIHNPLDAWAVSALESQAGGKKLRLVLAPAQEIAAAIQGHHQRALRNLGIPLKENPDAR